VPPQLVHRPALGLHTRVRVRVKIDRLTVSEDGRAHLRADAEVGEHAVCGVT
jgi:hypothetical protein